MVMQDSVWCRIMFLRLSLRYNRDAQDSSSSRFHLNRQRTELSQSVNTKS